MFLGKEISMDYFYLKWKANNWCRIEWDAETTIMKTVKKKDAERKCLQICYIREK